MEGATETLPILIAKVACAPVATMLSERVITSEQAATAMKRAAALMSNHDLLTSQLGFAAAQEVQNYAETAFPDAADPEAPLDEGSIEDTQAMARLTPYIRARSAIEARARRGKFFKPGLFADPGWDILLNVFAMSENGIGISVGDCCKAANVPTTTALRWIHRLNDMGLLTISGVYEDKRKREVSLAPKAQEAMMSYLSFNNIV